MQNKCDLDCFNCPYDDCIQSSGYRPKYYWANREKNIEKQKEYYQNHKEQRKQYSRNYYRINKEEILRKQKERRNANKCEQQYTSAEL